MNFDINSFICGGFLFAVLTMSVYFFIDISEIKDKKPEKRNMSKKEFEEENFVR